MGNDLWGKAVGRLCGVPSGVGLSGNQCYVFLEVLYLISQSRGSLGRAARELTTVVHDSLVGGAPREKWEQDISSLTFSWRMNKICWIDRLATETEAGESSIGESTHPCGDHGSEPVRSFPLRAA